MDDSVRIEYREGKRTGEVWAVASPAVAIVDHPEAVILGYQDGRLYLGPGAAPEIVAAVKADEDAKAAEVAAREGVAESTAAAEAERAEALAAAAKQLTEAPAEQPAATEPASSGRRRATP